jgi:succinate dehydrogenase / fumarate reductase iron-sulfur subunit
MALLPQGKEERNERVVNMVKQMDEELLVIAPIQKPVK